jgi:anthranilate phosphoribosyltransferase
MDDPTFPLVFRALLDPEQDHPLWVQKAFRAILNGSWTPVQVAGFAVALRLKGETPAIIAAAALALREAMVPVPHSLPQVVDTCGTGGDGLGTWNISTASAFVVAGAGVPVAKHGNRAVSSQCGSADVLERLGINLGVAPEQQADILQEAGIAFLFAPAHHPAMKHGGLARRELGIRTIFNALGPLANPASATHQLLGAYDSALCVALATTLKELGSTAAWVVRGLDGLDEISPCVPTLVAALEQGEVRELQVCPEDFGLKPLHESDLKGGNAEDNAKMIREVVANGNHRARSAVVLNAAGALCVVRSLHPKDAREQAENAISSGKAQQSLEKLVLAGKSRSQTPHA